MTRTERVMCDTCKLIAVLAGDVLRADARYICAPAFGLTGQDCWYYLVLAALVPGVASDRVLGWIPFPGVTNCTSQKGSLAKVTLSP